MKKKSSAPLKRRRGALLSNTDGAVSAQRRLRRALLSSSADLLLDSAFSLDPRFSKRTQTNDGIRLASPISDMLDFQDSARMQAQSWDAWSEDTLFIARRVGRA